MRCQVVASAAQVKIAMGGVVDRILGMSFEEIKLPQQRQVGAAPCQTGLPAGEFVEFHLTVDMPAVAGNQQFVFPSYPYWVDTSGGGSVAGSTITYNVTNGKCVMHLKATSTQCYHFDLTVDVMLKVNNVSSKFGTFVFTYNSRKRNPLTDPTSILWRYPNGNEVVIASGKPPFKK